MAFPNTESPKRKSKGTSPRTRSSGRSSPPPSDTLAAIQRLEARIQELETRPHPDAGKLAQLETELAELKAARSNSPLPAPCASRRPLTFFG